MSAQHRDETPPPRSRCVAAADRAVQQPDWSAKPGSNDWTSSPLTRPKDTFEITDAKEKGLLSPQANISGNRDFLPLKVNEDVCFSSPKPAIRGQTPGSAGESVVEGLFTSPSPQVGSCGKENWQPPQGRTPVRTPMKTPSRLPTVQEHDGQGSMPTLDEGETNPAWVVQSPQPATDGQTEFGMAMKGLGLSPAPPGLEDVFCALPAHQVKGTFIQFVSPLKTFYCNSPPKTEPVNFAPSTSAACSLLWDSIDDHHDESGLAMSHSPSPWFTHEQIPFFPHANTMPAAPPPPLGYVEAEQALTSCAVPKQKGPVVRLAEFLPEPSGLAACLAAPSELQPQSSEAYWMPPLPMMNGSEVSASGFGAGNDGMTSMWNMQATEQMQQQMQQQAQLQPQMLDPQMQQQAQPQLQQQLHDLQQMQAQLQQMQLQQMQIQQMQTQMQPPQMQPPQMQPPQVQSTQMQQSQPPQGQAPQLQPPQMQPPMQPPLMPMQQRSVTDPVMLQAPQMPPQMQPDNVFLQQLMQLQMQPQMQPPSWPPMQPPSSIAGEHVPAPPPQMAMQVAAPSGLCPNSCHQAQVCRCGEVKVGDSFQLMPSAAVSDEQQMAANGTMPNTCILLSAAMFPEMGTTDNSGRQ